MYNRFLSTAMADICARPDAPTHSREVFKEAALQWRGRAAAAEAGGEEGDGEVEGEEAASVPKRQRRTAREESPPPACVRCPAGHAMCRGPVRRYVPVTCDECEAPVAFECGAQSPIKFWSCPACNGNAGEDSYDLCRACGDAKDAAAREGAGTSGSAPAAMDETE